jgi:hypothetical protein
MWLGVVVASILGLALFAVLGVAINFARQRRFGVAFAIALPTCLVGYFFLSLAVPALWIEIAGDPNVQTVSEDAVQVPDDALQALYENNTHVGMYYDDGEWRHYRETFLANGTIRGKGGPEDDPELWSWTGQWKIEGGRTCFKYDGDFSCSDVFVAGDTYQYADGPDGDVESWFTIAAPTAELDPAALQLTGDALRDVIEDVTLTGRLMDAEQAVVFKAQFFAGNHAIYTQRGDGPDTLDQEEYGWYRLDGDRVCLSDTLGAHRDCFAVYLSGDSLSFVLIGETVAISAERPL